MISTNSSERRGSTAAVFALIAALSAPSAAIAPAALLGVGSLTLTAEESRAADSAGAITFIEGVGDKVVLALADPSMPKEERLSRLISLLNEATDLELIGKLVVGKHWRAAQPAQREAYLAAFEDLVMDTLAGNLETYGGETFTILGATAANQRDTVVHMLISKPGWNPFEVDWRVREYEDGHFALIDVVAAGISMIVTQRSEFNAVINRRGFDGLVSELRDRVNRKAS